MSLDAEIRSTAKGSALADSYDRIAKAVHWTALHFTLKGKPT
jgi:hypothetical protein